MDAKTGSLDGETLKFSLGYYPVQCDECGRGLINVSLLAVCGFNDANTPLRRWVVRPAPRPRPLSRKIVGDFPNLANLLSRFNLALLHHGNERPQNGSVASQPD